MTYVRLDDHFPQHRKILGLDDAAFALHVRAICYSSTQLSDGEIPSNALPLLTRHRRPRGLVAQLVESDLWESTLTGWRIHDYLDWQESSESVWGKRAAARQRMQRLRSQDVRANIPERSQDVRNCSPEVREQEVETETTTEKQELTPPLESPPPKKRRSKLPDDWEPSPTLLAFAAEKAPGVDVAAQTEIFRDHWRAKGEVRDDWDATFRNWLRRAPQFSGQATLTTANGHHPARSQNQINADIAARRMGLNPADSDPFGGAPDEPWSRRTM